MEKEEVKLLGFWISPFVQRVKWALKLKGVDFEYVEQDIINKSPLLLELNPVYKKVPVLVHNGKVIAESTIILEYIDETWKNNPSLLPHDPYQRSLARFWADFSENTLIKLAVEALVTKGEQQEKAVRSTMEAIDKLEQELKGRQFFGGDSIGYLDLVLGWISYFLPAWEELGSMKILDSSKFPAFTQWIDDFLSHPVIKNDLPPPRDEIKDLLQAKPFSRF
ncbi:hypothetical protein Leryth_006316 [Lithospermum erythrorhizon]|nr:hypothetical protein Leryth_006316 [Lithospermum erythrorhizon]